MNKLRWPLVFLLASMTFAGEPDWTRPFPTKRVTDRLNERRETMGLNRWISNDGDPAAAGSWSEGSAPAGADTAVFDGTSQVDVKGAVNTTSLSRIWVKPEYSGNIGEQGNPWSQRINASASELAYILHQGSGTFHWAGSTSVSVPGSIIVDSPNADAMRITDGGSDAIASIVVRAGGLTLEAGCSRVVILHVNGPQARVTALENPAGGTANQIDVFTIRTGIMVSSRATGTLECIVNGGFANFNGPGGSGIALMQSGGTVEWNVATSDNTLSTCYVFGGVLDFNQTAFEKAVTSMWKFRGGTINKSGAVTVTNLFDLSQDVPDFGN